jgi:hypothetical protein
VWRAKPHVDRACRLRQRMVETCDPIESPDDPLNGYLLLSSPVGGAMTRDDQLSALMPKAVDRSHAAPSRALVARTNHSTFDRQGGWLP